MFYLHIIFKNAESEVPHETNWNPQTRTMLILLQLIVRVMWFPCECSWNWYALVVFKITVAIVWKYKDYYYLSDISESNLTNIYQNINVENNKVVKRSRKAQATRELSRESRDDDVDIDEKIHNENPYGDVYANQNQISDILIKDLEREIQERSKKENDGFKKEYAVCITYLFHLIMLLMSSTLILVQKDITILLFRSKTNKAYIITMYMY